jgi:D-serine deaminase-like pyridoxal phosphate-dependent protein
MDGPQVAPGTAGPNGLPDDAYFMQLARDLDDAGFGTPQIVIDLDRLEFNADSISNEIGRDRYRIVEKSLPSLDLLQAISTRTGSNRFLVLHLPLLPALLAAFPTADVLVGKVLPTNAIHQFFQSVGPADRASVVARVKFLVDSRWRLEELATLATDLGVTLQVGTEIDVGIHRSGVRHVADYAAVLAGFVANASRIRFAGILGYDGHVTAAPGPPGLESTAARAAFRSVIATYQSFVDVVQRDFAMLWRDDLVLNSGGTETYSLHHVAPVNDVAAGGGMLRPGAYSSMFIPDLLPAIFLATPVLQRFDTVDIPFVSGPSSSLLRDNAGIEMFGGGWAAQYVWPASVQDVPIEAGPQNENLVPNQSLVMVPRTQALGPGDWVWLYPHQADAIFQFESILLVRGGRLQTSSWRAYPRRY